MTQLKNLLLSMKNRVIAGASLLNFVPPGSEHIEPLELSLQFSSGEWLSIRPARDGASLAFSATPTETTNMGNDGRIERVPTDLFGSLQSGPIQIVRVTAFEEADLLVAVQMSFDNSKALFIMNNGDDLYIGELAVDLAENLTRREI